MRRDNWVAVIKHHMLGSNILGIGGSEYTTIEAAISLVKKGFKVYLKTLNKSSTEQILKLSETHNIPKKDLSNITIGDPDEDPSISINMSGDALSGPADVIYFHYPPLAPVDAYYPGLKGFNKFAGSFYRTLNYISYPLVFKRASMILSNSWLTSTLLRKTMGLSSLIVHPPVNISDILQKPPLSLRERENYVLFVARISTEKKVELSLRFANNLKKRNIDMRIIVAGILTKYNTKYYLRLLEAIDKLRLGDFIEIKPNVSRNELVELYRRAFAYIHLTPREHFGISAVEAMAAGTPILTWQDSGTWTDAADRNSLIALPFNSLEEATEKLTHLIRNTELWHEMSVRCRTRSLIFEREAFHERFYNTIKPLLSAYEDRPRS